MSDLKMLCDNFRCGLVGLASQVLRAPDPFNKGCELTACPECREQTLVACCDEPDCKLPATCGTPTPTGYRHTCYKHMPRK